MLGTVENRNSDPLRRDLMVNWQARVLKLKLVEKNNNIKFK